MEKLLVLVNGLPGSGKTTLGRALASAMGARFLQKDAVKEALAGCIGSAANLPALGGIAMDAIWSLVQTSSTSTIIDSWWFRPRDLEFARGGIEKAQADRVVEVWCDVPADLARVRYTNRRRAILHRDEQHLAQDWDIWVERAAPLGLTPTVLVDTTRPVDCTGLAHRVERAASRYIPS